MSPQAILRAELPVRMRGLDKHEVRGLLATLAREIQQRDDQIAGLLTETARLRAEVEHARAEAEVARERACEAHQSQREQTTQLLSHAQEAADSLIAEAVQCARQILASPDDAQPPPAQPPAVPRRAASPSTSRPAGPPERVDPLNDPAYSYRKPARRFAPLPSVAPLPSIAPPPVLEPRRVGRAPALPAQQPTQMPAQGRGEVSRRVDRYLWSQLERRGWVRTRRGNQTWEYPASFNPTLHVDDMLHNAVPVEARLDYSAAAVKRGEWDAQATALGLTHDEAVERLGPPPEVPHPPTVEAEPATIRSAERHGRLEYVVTPAGFADDVREQLFTDQESLLAALAPTESTDYTGAGSRRSAHLDDYRGQR